MTLTHLREKLRVQASPARAVATQRFFKTGPGQYGEGDQFLGVSVPKIRALVRETDDLSEKDCLSLLHSKWHEERMLALYIWVRRFERAKKDEALRRRIVRAYLANTRWINNWDLVDTSAPQILGTWLLTHDRKVLQRLASSKSLWDQRIAVVSTQALIREGEFRETLELSRRFLNHPHDLIHKACGWMLREIGKRDLARLRQFLDRHAAKMPRTMLRYAIEKLGARERRSYLSSGGIPRPR